LRIVYEMSEDPNFQVKTNPEPPAIQSHYSDIPVCLKWLIIIGSVILGLTTTILGLTICINLAAECILAGIILM